MSYYDLYIENSVINRKIYVSNPNNLLGIYVYMYILYSMYKNINNVLRKVNITGIYILYILIMYQSYSITIIYIRINNNNHILNTKQSQE